MGQSHTAESASDTENDSVHTAGAAPINFFGLFGGKKDEYIDSTDSEITIEENRKDRKASVSNKNAKQRQQRIPKRANKISGNPRNRSPPERDNNISKKDTNNNYNPENKGGMKGNLNNQTLNENRSEPRSCIYDKNKCIGNRKGNYSCSNSRVIGCRERSHERSSQIERKESSEEKRTNLYSVGDGLSISKTQLIPTRERESETVPSRLLNNATNINDSTFKSNAHRKAPGDKENLKISDPNPHRNSITCVDQKSRSKICPRCSLNTNDSSTSTTSSCMKRGFSQKSCQQCDQSHEASICSCCCDAHLIGHKLNNCTECKNINGNCEKSSDANGDKPVRIDKKETVESATTLNTDVMNDYQRYSREPPEREQNVCGFAQQNVRGCCRNCYNQKKTNAPGRNTKPSHYSKHQKCCSNRPISDPYVPGNHCLEKVETTHSRSAPSNAHKGKSYSSTPRTASEQRPNIPLPPPPPKDCKNRHNHQFERQPSPACDNSSNNCKQMYNPHNYNYNKQHYKNAYSYEETPDACSYSHDTCCTHNCVGYEHCSQHRRCKCQCMCEPVNYYPRRNVSDDQLSGCSDSTKTDFMNLAYQRTGDYPELVDELENTLSQRNRLRVQKTMEQFEILSRQNKNLDKPIFDDEESCRQNRNSNNDCKCSCCKENDTKESQNTHSKSENETYKSRSESLTKGSNIKANLLPKKPGYVEKVARCMDPNLNRKGGKYMSMPPFNNPNKNPNQREKGTWKMDSRKGEWVKVNDRNYDFENSYPPLPPRPRSGNVYDERSNRRDHSNRNSDMERACFCDRCARHNR